MHPLVKRWEMEQKQKKTWQRVLTNEMTAIAYRIYKSNKTIHLALIVYRLRHDFGFTEWEVANLTGVPVRELHKLTQRFKKLLDAEIFKNLQELDWESEEDQWRLIPRGRKEDWQGYVIPKTLAWFENKKKPKKRAIEPPIKLGDALLREYKAKIREINKEYEGKQAAAKKIRTVDKEG